MTLRLHNTEASEKQDFEPIRPDRVGLYHCGPTVKEPISISKFRSYLFADVLRRKLETSGYDVHQVMNITDVGHLNEYEQDIVELAAARSGKYAWELAEEEEARFHDERRALRIRDADEYPRAREHVEDMIELVRDLEAKGVCYSVAGNVYLDVSKASGFGRLSGQTREEMTRLQERSVTTGASKKRHPLDIDLWRSDATHQQRWDSPWGRGFPGWHVECAAMSRRYLGGIFDIHTGGQDCLFPHHECEIAQVETLTGQPLARYWLHVAPVTVDGQPMSRAAKNLVTVRELLETGFDGGVIRAALLRRHYRETLDFGDETIDWARELVEIVRSFRAHLKEQLRGTPRLLDSEDAPWISKTSSEFDAALDDDLDWTRAASAVRRGLESLEPEVVGDPTRALAALESWDRVLGIL